MIALHVALMLHDTKPRDIGTLVDLATAPVVEHAPVLFHKLRARQCRYIAGPVDGLKTLACGQPTIDGSSYCGPHHARCHSPAWTR